MVVLDHVPKLGALLVLRHVVAADAFAATLLEVLAVAFAVVDAVHDGAHLVAVVCAMAEHALVDRDLTAEGVVPDGRMAVLHVGQGVAEIFMASPATAVVGIKIVVVVRRAAFVRTVPVVALVLGRRALNLRAVFQGADFGSVLLVQLVLTLVHPVKIRFGLLDAVLILNLGRRALPFRGSLLRATGGEQRSRHQHRGHHHQLLSHSPSFLSLVSCGSTRKSPRAAFTVKACSPSAFKTVMNGISPPPLTGTLHDTTLPRRPYRIINHTNL